MSTKTCSCGIKTGRWSGSTVRLLFLEQKKVGNLHTRAAEFASATGATISITSASHATWQSEVFQDAGRNGPQNFDGYIVKGNWIPSLVNDGGLADLSGLIELGNLWTDLRWTDIVPVVRDSICVYDGLIYSIPVDADYIVAVVRDDLQSPASLDTWEEFVAFAEAHHGKDLNGDGEADYGACLAKGEKFEHYTVFSNLWAIAAPHLQRHGRKAGAFFDPVTFHPLWASGDSEIVTSFHQALDLYKRLVAVATPGEVTTFKAKKIFQSGRCATWMNLPGLAFGVQDTGGVNATNLTTATMKRLPSPGVVCRSREQCTNAVEVPMPGSPDKTRFINRVPFFANGGLSLAVSSSASNVTQQLLFELYTYMSAPAQSNLDVTLRTSFCDPFRNSQLDDFATERLVSKNGWNRTEAASYHEIVAQTLNDEGAALDLRVPGIDLYQRSALEAIRPYVYGNNSCITPADAAASIAEMWGAIPSQQFPGSTPEAATKMMRGIYRAQLGLPPILNDGEYSDNHNTLLYTSMSLAIFASIFAAICAYVYVYVERRKKNTNSMWAVKREELIFDDPPTVLGRGTFGLVLLAEYRGTEVAVKRVIPPRCGKAQTDSNYRNIDGSNLNSSEKIFKMSSILGNGDNLEVKERTVKIVKQANQEMRALFEHDENEIDEETALASGSGVQAVQKASGATESGKKNYFTKKKHENLKADFIVEMRLLSNLRHPCITTVMGAVIDEYEEPMLVMEYMDYGSLYDILHNETVSLDGDLILPILRDVAQGVRFLHAADPQIIHGDIKAQNVLVDSKFHAKVADFGLSQKKEVGAIGTGTPLWMAPELLRGESDNTAASDIYSFGIILYEIYSREDPYEGENLSKVLCNVADPIINKRPPIPPAMPQKVSDIMKECVDGDQHARPTFEELDLRLKRLNTDNVEPGTIYTMDTRKSRVYSLKRRLNSAESLLNNVFPPHIVNALQEGRKIEQESHECVTIFFCDIVGFTTISQFATPQKVCKMLDRLYHRFDELSLKHDIFKIETIGDAYMAITNLVKDQKNDHVKRMADFSRDTIQAASETLIDEDDFSKGFIELRVGFHSGPVIADVIGSRLPKYGVFGDTVNTASRMESNSETGCIHCSETSAKLLIKQDPKMSLISRGNIRIKGKGEMHTYWVGREPDDIEKSSIV